MTAGANTGESVVMSINKSKNIVADAQSRFALVMEELQLDVHSSYLTALSGGADSSALALLTQQYANAVGKRHLAVIVDHGLRRQSYAEAVRVQDQMRSHGVTSDIISIDGPRPTSGLQEWARVRRYQLLMSVARDRQAVVLFAHHAGDQAETIAMRLLRGSGIVGLAGIPSTRIQHGITISRPLLGWSREQLLRVCYHFGYAFEDDPSNKDRQFERVRIRQLLAHLSQRGEGPSSDQLRRLGLISAKLSKAATNANDRPLEEAVKWYSAGYATILMKQLVDLPTFRFALLMRRLVMSISGSRYAPSRAALDELRNRIDEGLSATIGGCHFSPVPLQKGCGSNGKEETSIYRLFRETGRHLSTMPILAGNEVVFAGCWLVKSQREGTLHALGDTGKVWDDYDRGIIAKNMPEDWHLMPHRARQAIP
ncbi:tRNA lysidine(34) synthetase TilS, partial [Candidatus Puniceispirillum sp.]|nr:tRNA lysidine(34) synthetase TilS [Candidatus Puniceispirillum sp.]